MGGALRHALTRGLPATLVVGVLALLSPPAADAVSAGRPIAVAVAADGTSYVGFASGGRLLRIDPSGALAGTVVLDQPGPVTALDIAPGGHLWVDYGDAVSELTTTGQVLTQFTQDSGGACPADRAHDPARFGGIEVTTDSVYLAGRCTPTIGVYSRDGALRTTFELPGSVLPRGIAWGKAYGDLPARLYVAAPDAGKVFVYNVAALKPPPAPAPAPVKVLTIQRHDGFAPPVPGDVAVDGKGQLVVTDVGNNALYFYNGTENYWFYRTLGHPPGPGSNKGYLDGPAAIAQGSEDLRGHLWVADTRNGRIQRWDTDGTTQWMTDVLPPGDPGAPVNTALPVVSGPPAPGNDLTCTIGTWTGAPAAYAVSWLREGVPITGAIGTTYRVTAADVGTELTCVVVASAADGAASPAAASEPVLIPGPDSPPAVVTGPEITGNPQAGSVLHCTDGTWTDPTPASYIRGWLRDGQLLQGTNAADYLVTSNDVYHEISCQVAAVNSHGVARAAASQAVEIQEGGEPDDVDPPGNLTRPAIRGTAAVGSELFCDPGTWTNAPTFDYDWERDGTSVGGANSDHYTVRADDRGRRLRCVVVATNPSGSEQAASPAVVPTGGTDPGSGKTCRGRASVTIDGGARYARSRYVVLRVRAPAGASAVVIANDARFAHADTRPVAESCKYKWTLPKKPGTARVWVKFVGAPGSDSDDVLLDAWAPRLKRVVAHWRQDWWSWVLTIRASDKGSGLAKVEVGPDKSSTRWVKWGKPVNDADSAKLSWVRVWDRAGNASRWYNLRV